MSGKRVGALAVACALLSVCSDDDDDAGASTTAPVSTTAWSATVATAAPASKSAPATTPPTTPAPAAPWHTPVLSERDCPFDDPATARCSTLTVAADRADPEGGTIDLPVVVLPPTAPTGAAEAVVIPSGGPGYPGAGVLGWAGNPWNERYAIVLYDQRGTGGAVPSLECPDVDAAFVATLQDDGEYETERDAIAEARDACLASLEDQGIDLADYHTEASAADLDELRHALGYEQWNVLGVSYGARLALATMRSYPDGVRSVILDSVYDVTAGGLAANVDAAERAIAHLVGACAADATCTAAHGDLAAKIGQTRQQYNDVPAVVQADLGDGKGPQEWVITGDDMLSGLFNALYDAGLIPLLPSAIEALLGGDTSVLPTLIERGVPFSTGYADAMATAVNCSDNAGLGVEDDDAAVYDDPHGLGVLVSSLGLCPSGWPPTPGSFNDPVTSNVPALVLAGSFDPITPPAGSEAVAGRLANATFVLVEPVGHGATNFDDCITGIELAFLDDPTTPPDVSCAAAIPPPVFS